MSHPSGLAEVLPTKAPIRSFLLIMRSMEIMATGRTKLRTTWLKINAVIRLAPDIMISMPGRIVTSLVALSDIFKPTKPLSIPGLPVFLIFVDGN